MKFTEEFQHPGAQYRAKPFWAWNGKLNQKELLRQIDIMMKMGFGGFFMHSRTGLQTPYLGEEWFSLINACADRAKEYGVEAWLYDEDRWPSGSAGGIVTKNPEYRMHFLRMFREKEKQVGTYFASFAIRLQDGFYSDFRRIESDEETKDGEEKIYFSIIEMPCSSFYNGETYLDTMNRNATEAFLTSTHEKYLAHCGDRIGDSIPGIFTDEPNRGALMSSFGQGVGSGEQQLPWTKELPAKFQEKFGYDLTDHLPALFWRKDEKPAAIKWQYVEILEELFLENFARPIDQWCRNHNMILTGHVLHEDTLTAQTAMSGSMMRYYADMQYPGIDFLGEFGRCYWIAKQLQSVSRQLDKPVLLSELDGCTGWQMSFENYKAVGDWQALYGINLRCPHLSWYTMQGQAKRDYPASILHQSPWWQEYAYVEDYYARIACFAQEGKADCRVLVLHPIESVWARIHMGWCNGLSAKEEGVCRLEKRFADLFYLLQRNHIDFDYGDEGLMAEYASVQDGKLQIGQAKYDTVVISGLDTIRHTTAELLRNFSQMGGRLLVCPDGPDYIDCQPASMDWSATKIETDAQLIAALKDCAISITDQNGKNTEDILCQVNRLTDGELRLILLNDNRECAHRELCLSIEGKGPVYRFVPETGKVEILSSTKEGKYLKIALSFEAQTLILLSIGKEYPDAVTPQHFQITAKQIPSGPFQYRMDEPNLCVLDTASVSIDDAEWSEETEILRADRLVRKHFGLPYRGGEMLQPWFVGQRQIPINGKVSLRFVFQLDVSLPSVRLVLEEPEHFTVTLNGHPIDSLIPDFYWADSCFSAYEIPGSLLKNGENELILTTDYAENSNLEAIYLMGDFGVKLNGTRRILVPLPKTIEIGSIVSQGFPFYSGKLTYLVPVSQPKPNERLFLELDGFDGSCIVIEGNNQKEILAWKPYRADVTDLIEDGFLRVTVVLTRRNTFGPLHQLPAHSSGYGPGNFETTGEWFSNDCVLLDAGLTQPIHLLTQQKESSDELIS
jgi:hypothetical protein